MFDLGIDRRTPDTKQDSVLLIGFAIVLVWVDKFVSFINCELKNHAHKY